MADRWVQLMSEDGTDNLFPTSKMDLLWENASPSSSFSAQTISLDLSGYKTIYVLTIGGGNSKQYLYIRVDGMQQCLEVGEVGSIPRARYRGCTATQNSVSFTDAYLENSSSVGNNYCVPYQIYGIK